jgi:hypothetical protein
LPLLLGFALCAQSPGVWPPGGRMRLAPPAGFSALRLAEVRIGEDAGPFMDLGGAGGGPE